MKTPFKTNLVDGDENIMVVDNVAVSEVRFNRVTREIFIVSNSDTYTLEDLDGMSWQSIKSLVVKHGGDWESKSTGIDYLIGRAKDES